MTSAWRLQGSTSCQFESQGVTVSPSTVLGGAAGANRTLGRQSAFVVVDNEYVGQGVVPKFVEVNETEMLNVARPRPNV
jgi:hypothetical protein